MFQKIVVIFILACMDILHANEVKEKIVIAGPFASVSHPVLRMIETNALSDIAKEVEFRLWKNPDELRALVLQDDVDFVAVPTNTAAILHNKGVRIQLVNVSVWGILGMISRDKNLKTLKDFKGKKIVVPFRADMPDIVLTQLMKKQGLDPKKDFELEYVSSPIDAMQMLIMRRVDHALLAEPAISIALRKTKSFPISVIAPDLYRSTNLQEEWAEVFKTDVDIPQAGMAALGDMVENQHAKKRFLEEYNKALAWYKANPQQAAKLTVENLPMLQEEGVADSISHVNLQSKSGAESQEKIEFFFEVLKEANPKIIGGKLPEQSFYYKGE